MDRSLRGASSLVRHRNVLTRAERLDRLAEVDKWDASKPVLGLPKVANRKMALAKAEKAETAEGTAGATPAAAGAKPAAGAKGAAPAAAAGAKPAAGAKAAPAAPAAKKK